PARRKPNQNPSIRALYVLDQELEGGRCADATTVPFQVAPGQEIDIAPVEPDGVREVYQLPTFDGGTRTFTENLRYSWFATAGSFTLEQSGGPTDLFGNRPVLDTHWVAPSAANLSMLVDGKVSLWVVQRDERGGTYWTERCLQVVR